MAQNILCYKIYAAFLGLSSLQYAFGFRILLVPYGYPSHTAEISEIGLELQERGHEISILLPESYIYLNYTRSLFTVITFRVERADLFTMPESEQLALFRAAFPLTPIEDLRINYWGFTELCTNALDDKELPAKLKSSNFDLAVVDGFPMARSYLIILHNVDIPYVSFTTQYEPWAWRSPTFPSFVPFPLAGGHRSDRMSFIERVANLWSFIDWAAFLNAPYLDEELVRKYLIPKNGEPPQTFATLTAKVKLWLIDSDWSIELPRPSMPKEIYVGGQTTRPPKPLTGSLEKFADGALDGIIVVTFGSLDILEDEHIRKFLKAFSQIKQRVLFRRKYKLSPELEALRTDNVNIVSWVPQNDVFAHKNMRLFISHGGANSQFEALYNAVPTLYIPMFGDQPYNARRAIHYGWGLSLNINTFEVGELVRSINEMISNSSYKENAQKLSSIFRSRPDTPRQRAAWWIEHVIKYDTEYLYSYSTEMPWYHFLMLDMIAVLVILPTALCSSALTCCVIYCRLYLLKIVLRRLWAATKLWIAKPCQVVHQESVTGTTNKGSPSSN